jgi:NADH-quinone oxidoreductase subunit G
LQRTKKQTWKRIRMSDLVTLTIDGIELKVPKDTLVVDAAKRIEIDIPVFCYHPKMEPVGMCRMCLVEIGLPMRDRATGEIMRNDDGSPKLNFGKGLQTGCTVRVSEGMVVRTTTEAVDAAREDIIEFILTSHPLDCPICDKGGECPLQNLTMYHGKGTSRMVFEDKMRLGKRVPLGELIVLDRERCIQCARCTRFQAEIVDDPVIHFHERGRRLEIVTFTEPGFDSYWSGNTTDICPVGALTTTDFRFQARPWELTPVASICPHCPVGCNTTMDTRREAVAGGRNVIKRIMPRQNESVNEIWMCDKGRFVHHFADAPDRLKQPLIRRGDQLLPSTWDEALDLVAGKLQLRQEAAAGLSGDRLSNEALFLFQKLFRQGLNSNNLDLAARRVAGGDVVAKVGLSSGSNLKELGVGDAILVVAADLHEQAPVWWLRVRQAAQRGATLVILNPRRTRLDKFAKHTIYYRPERALAVARQLVNLARVDTEAVNGGALAAAAGALIEANNLVVFYGAEALSYDESDVLARLLANLLLLKRSGDASDADAASTSIAHAGRRNNGLVAVWPHTNTQGAWDMGIHPAFGPGYAPFPSPGLGAEAIYDGIADGTIKALYVLGADPVGDGLMAGRGQLDFLVVQELFLTETAKLADVVLPAQSWAEGEGTFTNGERRVQRYYPGIDVVGSSRADWQILAQLGERAGLDKPAFAASLVFRELARVVPQYQEMDYRSLARVEKQWPDVGSVDFYFGGTAYENSQGLGRQWAVAAETETIDPYSTRAEQPPADEARSTLQVIVTPALYAAGTLINHTELLTNRIARPTLFLHAADAKQLALTNHDVVTVTLEDGIDVEAVAHIASVDYNANGRPVVDPVSQGIALLRGVPSQCAGQYGPAVIRKADRDELGVERTLHSSLSALH